MRIGASEDYSRIHPISVCEGLFSPTETLSADILRNLYQAGLIYVDPGSSAHAFADDLSSFYLFKVAWLPPYSISGSSADIVREIEEIFRTRIWPEAWLDESTEFWRKMALHECLQRNSGGKWHCMSAFNTLRSVCLNTASISAREIRPIM